MKMGRDLVAGLIGSFGSMAIALLAVPFFIRLLGTEAYGLIGFSTALQGFLQLLDLGLAPAISRYVAQGNSSENLPQTRVLLRSLARVYWITAAAILVMLVPLAARFGSSWLNAKTLDASVVSHAVILICVQIACRWPSGLYIGVLTGARRVVTASNLSFLYVALSNLGALIVLYFVSRSIEAFFIVQALAGIAYTLALQVLAWKALGGARGARFEKRSLLSIWRFAAGMSGVGFVAVAITQLDKIVLSKLVSLEAFGYYMLATLVAGVLYRITTPVFNIIYPRFSQLVAASEEAKLEDVYRKSSAFFAAIWFPGAMALAVCARPLLYLWTGNPHIADSAALLLTFLAAGTAIHGIMFFPYALQLAHGAVRVTLRIQLVLFVIQCPLIIVLAVYLGVLGGAIAWLCFQLTYLFVGTWLTHNHMLRGARWPWLLRDVGVPLSLSLVTGLLIARWIPSFGAYPYLQIAIGAVAAGLAALLSLFLSPYRLQHYRSAFSE